jgi:transcriptional regulator with XRE-family HTH domain
MKKIQFRLAFLREERKLSQESLANIIGVDHSTIANYETGARFPKYPILIKIADYFGVSIDWLLGRTDIPQLNTFETALKGLPPHVQKLLMEKDEALPALELAADCVKYNLPIKEIQKIVKIIALIKG